MTRTKSRLKRSRDLKGVDRYAATCRAHLDSVRSDRDDCPLQSGMAPFNWRSIRHCGVLCATSLRRPWPVGRGGDCAGGDLAPAGRQHQRQPFAAGDWQPARDRCAGEVVPRSVAWIKPDRISRQERKADRLQLRDAINNAAAQVAKAPDVASVVNPLTPQRASALSKDQTTGYLSVTTSVNPGSLSKEQAQTIIDAANLAKAAGLEVETGGQLGQKVSQPSTESSELIGIIATMVILISRSARPRRCCSRS